MARPLSAIAIDLQPDCAVLVALDRKGKVLRVESRALDPVQPQGIPMELRELLGKQGVAGSLLGVAATLGSVVLRSVEVPADAEPSEYLLWEAETYLGESCGDFALDWEELPPSGAGRWFHVASARLREVDVVGQLLRAAGLPHPTVLDTRLAAACNAAERFMGGLPAAGVLVLEEGPIFRRAGRPCRSPQ